MRAKLSGLREFGCQLDRCASSLQINLHSGAVAQSGERVVRNDEVRGSIPLGSTIQTYGMRQRAGCFFARGYDFRTEFCPDTSAKRATAWVDGGGLGRSPLSKPGLFEAATEFQSAAKENAAQPFSAR